VVGAGDVRTAALSSVPDIRGPLESHVTVACPDDDTARLARWAERRGLDFAHIVLARGRNRSQPMLNLRGYGTAAEQVRAALDVARELTEAGFHVVRVKTEVAPWAVGVPQRDTVPLGRDTELHFEHHVKLLLPAGHDRARLQTAVAPHHAHVSWNARRTRDDGREERFVTQRCHAVGRATAERRLAALLTDLHAHRYHVLETEREFVLHDTHLALDDGWISPSETIT
jgi:hypothetical protein